MRDGVPLPGVSPPEVVSQLVHRVFGPLRPDRVRLVLDYHGLAGHPAGTLVEVAARHGVTPRTVSHRARAVSAAGAGLPVTGELITAATRRSAPGEDHPGRCRIAHTLGLPAPAAPEPSPRHPAGTVPSSVLPVARGAVRVLAAVGPLEVHTLLAAVTRARRFRDRGPVTATDLAAALHAAGAVVGTDGRWSAPPGVVAPDRYRAIVAAAAGRELTRAEMIDVLSAAGYRGSSATGRMSSSHPLFHRVGPGWYRVIGAPRTGG